MTLNDRNSASIFTLNMGILMMSEDKPMTVGDLVCLLKQVPQNSLISIPSPDGLMVNNENLYLERKFINWWGDVVFIKCRSWALCPKDQ